MQHPAFFHAATMLLTFHLLSAETVMGEVSPAHEGKPQCDGGNGGFHHAPPAAQLIPVRDQQTDGLMSVGLGLINKAYISVPQAGPGEDNHQPSPDITAPK